MRFEFKGKSGIRHAVTVSRCAAGEDCRQVPGPSGPGLFQYVDERRQAALDHVRGCERVSAASGAAKLFGQGLSHVGGDDSSRRSILSGTELPGPSQRETKSVLLQAVKTVAQQLGNTPAVCRACYIHRAILEAYADGSLAASASRNAGGSAGLAEESAVLACSKPQRGWREQLAGIRARREGGMTPLPMGLLVLLVLAHAHRVDRVDGHARGSLQGAEGVLRRAGAKRAKRLLVRKFCYVFTCEYCFSHWVTLGVLRRNRLPAAV